MTAAPAEDFSTRSRQALADHALRTALGNIQTHLVAGRNRAVADVPEFEALRDAASSIKEHVLRNLDVYLEMFARQEYPGWDQFGNQVGKFEVGK